MAEVPQDEANRESGARLRDARQRTGKSQEDISFAAGIDQSALSKVERLGPQAVTWKKLFAIANAMGLVVEVTFRERGEGGHGP